MPNMSAGSKRARYSVSISNQNQEEGPRKAGLVPTEAITANQRQIYNERGYPKSLAFMMFGKQREEIPGYSIIGVYVVNGDDFEMNVNQLTEQAKAAISEEISAQFIIDLAASETPVVALPETLKLHLVQDQLKYELN